jgi:hypothetical protein
MSIIQMGKLTCAGFGSEESPLVVSRPMTLKRQVPLTDLLLGCLRAWQAETMYGNLDDWVFASARNKGCS